MSVPLPLLAPFFYHFFLLVMFICTYNTVVIYSIVFHISVFVVELSEDWETQYLKCNSIFMLEVDE